MALNLYHKDFLLELLLKIEFSLYSPVAERHNKKCCPFCGQFQKHDPECDLNIHLLELLANKFSFDTMRLIHIMLRRIEWCGYNQICPCCENQKGQSHEPLCMMKEVEKL